MKFIFTICFSCSVLLLCGQESRDTTVYLTEMVVSANKIPETRSKISQQIQVITDLQIGNLNVQTSGELVANSGLVTLQKSQQGGGSPQLRGFEASRVLLVVDGVRMNNLIYRAGHLQNILTLDNNSLERVEILLGPSSTVYGSDALGGVIHFKTRDPILAMDNARNIKANAFLRYASANNENSAHVDVNLGGKQFGSWTSLTYNKFDDLEMGKRINPSYGKNFGLRNFYIDRRTLLDSVQDVLVQNDNRYIQKFSGYEQADVIQKFLFKTGPRVQHLFNFQFSTSTNIPRYDRLTDPEGSGLRTAEWYYGPQKRLMTAYQISINELGALADRLVSTVSYQQIKESRHDRRFNRPDKRSQIEDVDVIGLTLDFNKTLGNSNLRYGFDSQLNSLASKAFNKNVVSGEVSAVPSRYPNGQNKMNFLAFYLTHTWDVTPLLTIVDGARLGLSALHSSFTDKTFFPFPFDKVNQKNTYAGGNVGVIYRPASWKFSFMTSTGYRVPNVDDLSRVFETNAGTALIIPNPDVKPEKTITFDLSATKYFMANLRWENTGYYTLFYDAIILDRFSFNGESTIVYDGRPTPVLANQNKRKAFITGFSSVLEGELHQNFSVAGSVNFTKGRIKTDSTDAPLDHIAPTFGRLSLKFQKQRWYAETFVNFNGWKRIDDYLLNSEDNEAYATEMGMPSWYTINLRGSYAMKKYITFQIGVDNLLDLQYRTFSSGINAPGRNFIICIRSQI